MPNVLRFIILFTAGWVNRHQQAQIEYLKEENRILREHIPGRRIRFTDDQRRRLARKAQALGRRGLKHIAGIVTPETLLRCYRNLIARKYDGSAKRGPGRPRTNTKWVQIAGFSSHPNAAWVAQIARNTTDPMDGFLAGFKVLIMDNDPLFASARHVFQSSGI